MFSKLKRSKAYPNNETSKLRGMPALKQERSNKRNGLSSPMSLPDERQQQQLTEFDRTGIASSRSEMKFIGTKPDILQNTLDHNSLDGMSNNGTNKTLHQVKNERKTKENQKHSTSKLDKKRQVNGLPDPEKNEKEHKLENGYGKKRDEGKSAPNTKKVQNDKAKGRRLHSVKKQRKASRDCDVTTSMRALTPRERESILFLEETLKEIDQGSFKASQHESDTENNLSDSDSFGSIIDLVGNLPTSRSQQSTAGKSVCKQESQKMQDTSVSNAIRSKYITNRVYAEIADVNETVAEEHIHTDDIYQEIIVTNSNNNLQAPTRDKRIEEAYSSVGGSKAPVLASQCNDVTRSDDTQPVYSVVRKTRKTTSKDSSRNNVPECGRNHTNCISSQVLPTPESNKKEVSVDNRRKICNHSLQRKPNRVKSMYNPIPSLQVLPSLAETSIDASRLSNLHDIDESLRVKPRQFVVVPTKGKTPPAIVPRKLSTKLRRHQSERTHAEHSKLKTVNCVVQDRLNFDQHGNLTNPSSDSIADLDSMADKMIAIPRQTTLYERPEANGKPFVITPANRQVISWK